MKDFFFSLVSGLLGTILALWWIGKMRTRVHHARQPGQLGYGPALLWLALACAAFSGLALWAWFHDLDAPERISERLSILALLAGFGIAAVYALGEYLAVGGQFDETGIDFHSPWSGTKKARWEDLKSVGFNDWAQWYRLEFDDGSVIRLSTLLGGHGDVLELLLRQGRLNPEED